LYDFIKNLLTDFENTIISWKFRKCAVLDNHPYTRYWHNGRKKAETEKGYLYGGNLLDKSWKWFPDGQKRYPEIEVKR
jgi:hypothetical protein